MSRRKFWVQETATTSMVLYGAFAGRGAFHSLRAVVAQPLVTVPNTRLSNMIAKFLFIFYSHQLIGEPLVPAISLLVCHLPIKLTVPAISYGTYSG